MAQAPNTPLLTWLRAFEAAARLGSLKGAAEELSVTPSTISHHVRDLDARGTVGSLAVVAAGTRTPCKTVAR
jgi:DNA-binding MarR family transcriptional regulator